ncbi:MAG: UPF0182 family protein [Acidimicrobiales bacterium]|nr:UPF0182 family protein [Acidimicrobiales bacterium]
MSVDPENSDPRPEWAQRRRARAEQRARRRRAVMIVVPAVLVVLLLSLRGIASFYTDKLWFESLGLESVWTTALGTRVSLWLLGAGIFFGLCWSNLAIAERLAPVFRPVGPADDLIERYHDLVGRRSGQVRLAMTVLLTVMFGSSLAGSWQEWLLFRNRVPFGQVDATFGVDIGFYVFQLPFLTAALAWLFSAVLVILFAVAAAHVLNGGIRLHAPRDRATPQVKAHLSVLLALLALVQGLRYWVGRYELTLSTRGTVDGATYTVSNVELRSTYLLVMIAMVACGLFIANIWRRGWSLPVMAVGLWVFVAALAGGLVPTFVQRFRVEPSESSMEARYIANNITATRAAYGLEVDTETFKWDGKLDADAIGAEVETLQNVRLWDPAIMQASFGRQQQLKGFYEINDVDVDRYVVDGKTTPVMVSARDLDTAGVEQSSWEATHLAFTHGYGVIAAKANDRTASGDPDLVVSGIPVSTAGGMAKVTKPGIYFGERNDGYVIVDTGRSEIDYQDAENEAVTTTYDGADGVEVGDGFTGFTRRAAFALRFGDINPLVSGNIDARSKVLIERDVVGRLEAVAPFLAFDHDPYVVMVDGSVKYVVDGYTTSANYPNAQRADTGGLGAGSGLRGRSFNYVRNSVKAVVDAYDGTVTLYVVDGQDPLIRAYSKAFPDLFTDGAEVPAELRAHFRYPEDLFTVQTQMWSRYHVTDADSFYNGNSAWAIPPEPGGKTVSGDSTVAVGADGQPITSGSRYESKYQMLKLPGDERASFVLLRPYVGASRGAGGQNLLTAFMVASSDPDSYGKLRSFVMPGGKLPDGPITAADNIQADEAVAALRRNLCQGQSTCALATPSIVPIGNSILYVQSFFVSGTELGAPKLERVIVSFQTPTDTRIEVDETLRGALVKLFGDDVPTEIENTPLSDPAVVDSSPEPGEDGTDTPSTTTPEGGTDGSDAGSPGRQADLIAQLEEAFQAADAAARKGDMVGYSREIQRAREISAELAGLGAEDPSITTTTTGA